MKTLLGIDEAGRGCVLGPMVLTGVLFDESKELFSLLKSSGVRDSKALSPKKRAEVASVIRKYKKSARTVVISAKKIDSASLNLLEIEHSATIINKLGPNKAYLDVPASGRGIKNYCAQVRYLCKHKETEVIGGNHFDSILLVVAAASILAKERRELEVKKLHKIYGDFGSGYAHDPKTQKWLFDWKSSGERWPSMVRTKWETVVRLT